MPPAPLTVVHKFGGAALADAAAVARVAPLLARAGATATMGTMRRVVVASAMAGVTDALAAAARQAAGGDVDGAARALRALRARHLETAKALLAGEALEVVRAALDASTAELAGLLREARLLGDVPAPLLDRVVAHGERASARLVHLALEAAGVRAALVDATRVLHTDGRAGDAAPDHRRTALAVRDHLVPLLARGEVVVVPGFLAAAPNGGVVTLGRGGSDLTATTLARALEADEVVLWKDVPGLMTADPRLVPAARVVPAVDPREAAELACFGAKVLHPRALVPLEPRTTLRLRPFGDPDAAGTTVAATRGAGGSPVRALTAMLGQALVTVSGRGMLGVPGVAARAFTALAAADISVSMISQASSEHSICFTVPDAAADLAAARLRAAFAPELARDEVDDVVVRRAVATIAVVGAGMARTPGIAARIFEAVAGAGVNVIAIAQGASERNVTFVVVDGDARDALRAVHDAFHLAKIGGGRVARRAEPRDVLVLGLGRIGRELVTQLPEAARQAGAGVRVVGVVDQSGFVFSPRGLGARRLDQLVRLKERGGALADHADARRACAHEAVTHAAAHALHRPVLVDVASGDTRAALEAGIAGGMDLVLANKYPLAVDADGAQGLLRDARDRGRRVLHEATVGAGLPVIDTLQQLVASGDRVLSVEGCPSGTLGFLFGEVGRGRPFSEALRDAMARGYTEPDPRDDLCGLDVARKGVILGRHVGWRGALQDVGIESLVPAHLRDVPLDAFLDALPGEDAAWAARAAEARARGEVLRYRVRATRGGVRVGLVGAPLGGSLASLEGTDNLFVFRTARYHDRPLVVSGPGAGVQVTAAGVLGDLLRITA